MILAARNIYDVFVAGIFVSGILLALVILTAFWYHEDRRKDVRSDYE